jgi:hypothetical protein
LPHGLQLADEVALAGLGVVAPGEVVAAEVLVVDVVGEHVPGDHEQGVAYREGGLALAIFVEPPQQVSILGGQVTMCDQAMPRSICGNLETSAARITQQLPATTQASRAKSRHRDRSRIPVTKLIERVTEAA